MNNQHPRTRLTQTGKFGWWKMLLLAAVAIVSIWAIATVKGEEPPPPAMQAVLETPVVAPLDVCRDTPEGYVPPGGDITKALQWAVDHAQEHQRPIAIPGGRWALSDTVTTPFRSGLVLTGAGVIDPKCNRDHSGMGTLIEWKGEPGGVALRCCGRDSTIGNFTIDGGGKLGIALLVEKPRVGLGTGKATIKPLYLYRMACGIQLGTSVKMNNCDLCTFERIEADRCDVAYRQVTQQALDNRIERLTVRKCPRGLLLEGGNLVVDQWLCNQPGTLFCHVPETDGFGPNNGVIVLRGGKVDNQASPDFQLVKCEDPAHLQFIVEEGQISGKHTGTLVELIGSNSFKADGFRASYSVAGKRNNWGTPVALIRGTMLGDYRPPAEWFAGDVNARVESCWRTDGTWVDYDSQPGPDYQKQIDEIRDQGNGLRKQWTRIEATFWRIFEALKPSMEPEP